MLSASRDWDLRSRYEPIPHVSSHGALHREHMLVPLLLNRPPRTPPRRTVDVMPSALAALGKPIPGPWQPLAEWELEKGQQPQSKAVSAQKARYLRVTLVANHGNADWIGLSALRAWGRRSTPRTVAGPPRAQCPGFRPVSISRSVFDVPSGKSAGSAVRRSYPNTPARGCTAGSVAASAPTPATPT